MRVLHTIETHGPGGAESVLLSLAEGTAENGWPTPHGFFIKEGWLAEEFRKRGFSATVTENRRTLDGRLVRRMASIVRSEGVDLIHVHEIGMGSYAAAVGVLLRVPLVVTVHGRNETAATGRVRRIAYGLALRTANVVSVSRELKTWIAGTYGLSPDSIQVIENGIDLGPFDAIDRCESRRRVRNSLGIPDEAVVAVSVGRLFPVKNHDLMLRAFRGIGGNGPEARLVLVGNGPERGNLEEKARSYGLGGAVQFLGERGDVPAILAAADLFLLTSSSEGLSIAIMEAMASRLPVIATAVGDNGVLIQDGVTGRLVDVRDEAGLTEHMRRLIQDVELRREMGARGRERVERRFSRTKMVADYRRTYEAALGRR